MARVPPASPTWTTKAAYVVMRRALRKLTGRSAEGMLQPLEALAHLPGALAACGKLEQATAKPHHIALENFRGRLNKALGIGPAGFSEGMVCAIR